MRLKNKLFEYLNRNNYSAKECERVYYALFSFVLLCVAILIEVFLFNYKHWTTVLNKPEQANFVSRGSLERNDDGTYTVCSDEINLEILGLNQKVTSLFVEIAVPIDVDFDSGSIIMVDFDAMDESHHSYYSLNRRIISSKEPRSYYFTPHLYGNAHAIKIRPYVGMDSDILVNMVLNPVIPIFFRWERILLVYGFMLLILFFRPSSILHKVKYLKMPFRQKYIVLCAFLIVNALILRWVNEVNPFYRSELGVNTIQYQELAEAFSHGQLSLLDKPCDTLVNMSNPYDMGYRSELMEFGEWYFDHAYYEGKYYVYFGVVPCALLYFPYYVLTGEHIHNHTVCYIGILLILMGMILVIDEIIRKYYKKCSVGEWFLFAELMLLGSYVTYVTKRPDLYSVPIIWGVAFALLGLWAFMKAVPDDKKSEPKLHNGYIIAGSIFTALICGCRPQLFLVFILDIIVLKEYIFNPVYIKSGTGKKTLAAVIAPMAVIGALLMMYNYARFGSPFDFGAYYNLTFNDMRNRGFVWDRIPYGLSVFLLHPVEFLTEYPYFGNVEMNPKYMGVTIQETTYGGLFMTVPFSLAAFGAFFFRKKLKKKEIPLMMAISCVVISLVIIIFDVENAGITARYFMDFSFLWNLGAILTTMMILGLKELRKSTIRRVIIWLLIAFVIFEIGDQILVFMLDSGDYLKGNRLDLFYHYYYMFGFGI